jgi:hypothetical protein
MLKALTGVFATCTTRLEDVYSAIRRTSPFERECISDARKNVQNCAGKNASKSLMREFKTGKTGLRKGSLIRLRETLETKGGFES